MVRIVPNHSCPVADLFGEVVFVRGNEVVGMAAVTACDKAAGRIFAPLTRYFPEGSP